jgi:hypothetical protein
MDQAMGNENPGRAALTYLTRGWAAIPIEPGGKRPLVRWEPYQREPPSEPEIEHWFRQWPEANVGWCSTWTRGTEARRVCVIWSAASVP